MRVQVAPLTSHLSCSLCFETRLEIGSHKFLAISAKHRHKLCVSIKYRQTSPSARKEALVGPKYALFNDIVHVLQPNLERSDTNARAY